MKPTVFKLIALSGFILMLTACQNKSIWETDRMRMTVNRSGNITSILDIQNNKEIIPPEADAPLLQLRINGEFIKPSSMTEGDETETYFLDFDNHDIKAKISVSPKKTHIRFELLEISQKDSIDLILWGPYPTTISQTIGETVGVVRDSSFAFGIQALNLKTLGGYPYEESDIDRAYDIFETSDLVDVADSVKVLYRGHTAERKDFGSVVQAYCRNRNVDRIIPNWNHEYYYTPAFDDGGVTGSAIAIFGCPADEALNTIGEIELAENLSHPILDGEWGKTARSATASYLIMNFGEESLERAMDLTKEAGLKYLYHGSPFLNWGHFDLNEKEFPDNWASMKRCVDRAEEEGIRLGVHTLSNFITTNDPYVSPVPDHRLAAVGWSELTEDISPDQKDILIKDPKFFNQMKNNTLHAVRIENEILRYKAVSESEPWRLLDCERGAFGTEASAHTKGTEAYKLMDHGYQTFLTNIDLSEELALRLADLFNSTGLRQISFDGLEGNWSTGLGQYGRQRFTQIWYDNLKPELKGNVITDASNPGHFFWHIYTRMNWGEPWYAGFRESQTQYRLLNQAYYRRNLMPSMLGWFRMTPEISIEDIEWLLARAAGFDAGFALVTGPEIVENHGMGKKILSLIKLWESARLQGAFPEKIKKEMEDINNEYHLEAAGPKSWDLYKATIVKGEYVNSPKQPGEPNILSLDFDNQDPEQPVQFVITNKGESALKNITLDIDKSKKVLLPLDLPPGHQLKYTGGSYMTLYDKNWHEIEKGRVVQGQLMLEQGDHNIQFEAAFEGGSENSKVRIEYRTLGLPVNIRPDKMDK